MGFVATFSQQELMMQIGDDVQDFDTRWDYTFSGTSEMPPENDLEGLHKN